MWFVYANNNFLRDKCGLLVKVFDPIRVGVFQVLLKILTYLPFVVKILFYLYLMEYTMEIRQITYANSRGHSIIVERRLYQTGLVNMFVYI